MRRAVQDWFCLDERPLRNGPSERVDVRDAARSGCGGRRNVAGLDESDSRKRGSREDGTVAWQSSNEESPVVRFIFACRWVWESARIASKGLRESVGESATAKTEDGGSSPAKSGTCKGDAVLGDGAGLGTVRCTSAECRENKPGPKRGPICTPSGLRPISAAPQL